MPGLARPRNWNTAIALAIFVVLAALPPIVQALGASYWISLLTRVMIFSIATLSLDLILGLGGLVSFGHAAFVGIGAYMTAILIAEGYGDLLVILPVVLLCSAAYGAFSGWISLRTRGVAFIMITLAFGQMAYFFAQALYAYGGDDGMTLGARSTFAGMAVFDHRLGFYYIVLAVLAGCYLLVRAIADSRFGRALVGARDNEVRMASLGYDVLRIRLSAFVIAGMIAAVSGVLLANHTEFVSPAYISWQRSGDFIFMAIIGGLGSLWGAIAGTALFLLVEEGLSGVWEHWKAIFGLMIVLFVLFTRGGLSGFMQHVLGPGDHDGGSGGASGGAHG